jgi:hypothetical protein
VTAAPSCAGRCPCQPTSCAPLRLGDASPAYRDGAPRPTPAAARGGSGEGVRGAAPRVRDGSGTTTTGQSAWWTTWLLIEPSASRCERPPPRAPITSRSVTPDASMSSCAANPLTARTLTAVGRFSPSPSAACVVAAIAASRAWSCNSPSVRVVAGSPVQKLGTTSWTVMIVIGHCRAAASCMAQSRARRELSDPSTPTVIPSIALPFWVDPPSRMGGSPPVRITRAAGGRPGPSECPWRDLGPCPWPQISRRSPKSAAP